MTATIDPTPLRRRPRALVRSESLRTAAVVLGPALLAVALCVYELDVRSLWIDESATVAIASQHGAAFGAALGRDGGNMLGYYALMHVLIGWFGNGTIVLRLPSVLAAAATVAVVSLLAIRLFDRRVAALAGLLAAVSLSLVYWGQNGRGYEAMVALVAASFLALVAMLDGEGAGRGAWLAYVLALTAATYAGLEAVLVIPAQLVVVLWHRDRVRPVIAAVLSVALCCIPLAVLAANRGAGQLFWVPAPNARTLGQVIAALASSGLQPKFYTASGHLLLVLTGVVLLGACVQIVRALTRSRTRPTAWPLALVLSWLLIPFALAWIESQIGQSIFQARYLLISLPAVALLIGWALAQLSHATPPAWLSRWSFASARPRALPRVLAVLVLAALLALRALQVAPSYGRSPEPWSAAVNFVLERSAAGDCLAFYPLDTRMPFRYYLGSRSAPRSVLPNVPWGPVHSYVEEYATLSAAQLGQLPSKCSRVWLVSSHEGAVGGPPLSAMNYTRFRTLRARLRVLYPKSSKLNFGYRNAITIFLYRH